MTRNQRPQLGWPACAWPGKGWIVAGWPPRGAGGAAAGAGGTGAADAVGPGVTGSAGFGVVASENRSRASLPLGRSRVTGWANPALVVSGLEASATTSPGG